MQQFEPATEVPDSTVFGRIGGARPAYLHRTGDYRPAGRRASSCAGSAWSHLRGAVRLAGGHGSAISEALNLTQADVDLQAGLLTVRRRSSASPGTCPCIRARGCPGDYRQRRDLHITPSEETPFFITTRGRLLGGVMSPRQVDRVFEQLRQHLGWVNRGSHAAIRVHDLRHTFIVRRLVLWQAQGVDIDQAMLALSTYVGHVRVSNTYWYLSGGARAVGTGKRALRAAASQRGGAPCLRSRCPRPRRFRRWCSNSSRSIWSTSVP